MSATPEKENAKKRPRNEDEGSDDDEFQPAKGSVAKEDAGSDADDDIKHDEVPRAPKKPKLAAKIFKTNETPRQWELGKLKKVTVDEFKGMLLVSIREFYTDKSSGEEKPGKKGISLSVDQWKKLKAAVDEIDAAVTERSNK